MEDSDRSRSEARDRPCKWGPSDNRLCNLREATRSQNQLNCRGRRNSALGVKGVSKATGGAPGGGRARPWGGKYQASIWVQGRQKHLGTLATIEAAKEVWWSEYSARNPVFGRKE